MDDNEASGPSQVLKCTKKCDLLCTIFDNFYSLPFRVSPSIPLFCPSPLFSGSSHHFSTCFQPHFQIYRPSSELSHYSPALYLFPLHRLLTLQLIKQLLKRGCHPLGQAGMTNGWDACFICEFWASVRHEAHRGSDEQWVLSSPYFKSHPLCCWPCPSSLSRLLLFPAQL